MTKKQRYIELIQFMNEVYNVLDEPMTFSGIYEAIKLNLGEYKFSILLTLYQLEKAKLIKGGGLGGFYERT